MTVKRTFQNHAGQVTMSFNCLQTVPVATEKGAGHTLVANGAFLSGLQHGQS